MKKIIEKQKIEAIVVKYYKIRRKINLFSIKDRNYKNNTKNNINLN